MVDFAMEGHTRTYIFVSWEAIQIKGTDREICTMKNPGFPGYINIAPEPSLETACARQRRHKKAAFIALEARSD